MSQPTKSDLHFDHVIQDATPEQMDRIWDAFIDAVEKERRICAGSFHPIGSCDACKDEE